MFKHVSGISVDKSNPRAPDRWVSSFHSGPEEGGRVGGMEGGREVGGFQTEGRKEGGKGGRWVPDQQPETCRYIHHPPDTQCSSNSPAH